MKENDALEGICRRLCCVHLFHTRGVHPIHRRFLAPTLERGVEDDPPDVEVEPHSDRIRGHQYVVPAVGFVEETRLHGPTAVHQQWHMAQRHVCTVRIMIRHNRVSETEMMSSPNGDMEAAIITTNP